MLFSMFNNFQTSMSLFNLPSWLKPHLYEGKTYNELSLFSIAELKRKLERFKEEEPDVSVVIPAWNEERNIFKCLSSLASTNSDLKVEIIVINNNSNDNTQRVLDELGVKSYHEQSQGIAYARQLGLKMSKGRYLLCADSDTLYPPSWIDLMVAPLISMESGVVGVYGRYSFVPTGNSGRFFFAIYELITSVLIRIRKSKKEYVNVLGFNMGFITSVGKESGGFQVSVARKFDNALGSDNFVHESEDGIMALNLQTRGKLELVSHPKARVFTSTRRIEAEGGLLTSFKNKVILHTKNLKDYLG